MAIDRLKGNPKNQESIVRRQAEEYQKKEAELKKTHEAQLQRVRQKNENTIKKLQNEQSETIDSYRGQARQQLTEKDRNNQEKINEMNRTHKNIMRKIADEHERALTFQKEAANEEISHLKSAHSDQGESVQNSYDDYIGDLENNFKNSLEDVRTKSRSGIAREKNQLQTKAEDDRRLLSEQSRDDLGQALRDKETTRRNKDAQLKALKWKQASDKAVMKDKFENTIKNMQVAFDRVTQYQRKGFDEALDEMRAEQVKSKQKMQSEYDDSLVGLKGAAGERIQNQVTRLENKIASLKTKNLGSEMDIKARAKDERKNLIEQLVEREKQIQKQRIESIHDSNEKNKEVIEKVVNKNSQILSDQASFYKNKMNSLELVKDNQTREQLSEMEAALEKQRTKSRIALEKEKNLSVMQKREIEERFKTLTQQMRRNHADQLADQKSQALKSQTEVISSMQRVMKQMETRNESKIAGLVQKYEEKIMDMGAKAKASLTREKEIASERMKALGKHHEMQMKSQELQHQNTLDQLQEKHEHQVEKLRRRLEKIQAEQVKISKGNA